MTAQISGWGALEQALEDERVLFNDVTRAMGSVWDHGWLPAYANDDRGYELTGDLYKIYSDSFDRLREITSTYPLEQMPVMQRELKTMGYLKNEILDPAREIIFDEVPGSVKMKKLMLSPLQYALLSYYFPTIRIYIDYRNGKNSILTKHFIDEKPVSELVKKYKSPLCAFLRKWNEKFGLGSVEEFGFITYVAVDSHDNTVLPKVLNANSSKQVTDILRKERPGRGVNRVIRQNKEKIRSQVSDILHARDQKEGMCNVSNLRMRLKREQMAEYTKKIFDSAGIVTNYGYTV